MTKIEHCHGQDCIEWFYADCPAPEGWGQSPRQTAHGYRPKWYCARHFAQVQVPALPGGRLAK